jgi:hypothetical protein
LRDELLELLAGLELALYREQEHKEPHLRLVWALEKKIKETREKLRVTLYGVQESSQRQGPVHSGDVGRPEES